MNLYLSQFCLEMPKNVKREFLYLPYSVGCIWAYANQNHKIKENFKLKEIFIRKEDPEKIISGLDDPKVFGFSSYVWNHHYNLKVAKLVKEKYPKCVIIFGGPNVPVGDPSFLKEHDYIDYCVFHEGEIKFQNILLNMLGENQSVDSMKRIPDLHHMPSPYTTGLFDHIIEKYKNTDIVLNAIHETNRGCPFGCTFCDWGNGALGKVKKFNLKRVKSEILWCAKNQIEFLACADANFGAFKERDLEIVQFLCRIKKRYNWPKIFDTSWHKNSSEKVLEIAEIAMNAGLLRRFSASLQSVNKETLSAIKRTNISNDILLRIMKAAKDKNIEVGTELMLPLPLETYSTFLDNIEFCIKNNTYMTISPTGILVNSEMNKQEYKEKYGLKTLKNKVGNCEYATEYEEIIIETSTMSTQQINDLMLLVYVLNLHDTGFTNLIAKYYHKKFNKKFVDFYDRLWKYFAGKDGIISDRIKPFLNHTSDGTSYQLYTGISVLPMLQDFGEDNRELFYSEIKSFCEDVFEDAEDINDLISLQYNWQNHRRDNHNYHLTCKSNLLEYLNKDFPHKHETTTYLCTNELPTEFKSIGDYIILNRFKRGWKSKIESTKLTDVYKPLDNTSLTLNKLQKLA